MSHLRLESILVGLLVSFDNLLVPGLCHRAAGVVRFTAVRVLGWLENVGIMSANCYLMLLMMSA